MNEDIQHHTVKTSMLYFICGETYEAYMYKEKIPQKISNSPDTVPLQLLDIFPI